MYIARNVRLSEEDKKASRVILFDSGCRVIASSDGNGVMEENLGYFEGIKMAVKGNKGFTLEKYGLKSVLVAYAHTPGYETYKGLGWGCGIIYLLN
jgi:hypothetical protein